MLKNQSCQNCSQVPKSASKSDSTDEEIGKVKLFEVSLSDEIIDASQKI